MASVSIVIPAFNEENGIGPVLDQLCDQMRETTLTVEIIVVDDGSADGTARIAESKSNVRVIRHALNKGYGASLKTGIRAASHEIICITDADGTYPNDRIPELVNLLEEGYDMIVGARTGANVAIPLIRRPAKKAIGTLANAVAGERIPDINSGLRVFRKSAAFALIRLLPDGFSFTTTITLGMFANDYRVKYVPIDYFKREGKSKIRPIADTLKFTRLILTIGLYFAPLKVFLPASLFLVVLGVAWGVYSYVVLGRIADVSTLVIMMTAVQIAATGLIAEQINHRVPRDSRPDTV